MYLKKNPSYTKAIKKFSQLQHLHPLPDKKDWVPAWSEHCELFWRKMIFQKNGLYHFYNYEMVEVFSGTKDVLLNSMNALKNKYTLDIYHIMFEDKHISGYFSQVDKQLASRGLQRASNFSESKCKHVSELMVFDFELFFTKLSTLSKKELDSDQLTTMLSEIIEYAGRQAYSFCKRFTTYSHFKDHKKDKVYNADKEASQPDNPSGDYFLSFYGFYKQHKEFLLMIKNTNLQLHISMFDTLVDCLHAGLLEEHKFLDGYMFIMHPIHPNDPPGIPYGYGLRLCIEEKIKKYSKKKWTFLEEFFEHDGYGILSRYEKIKVILKKLQSHTSTKYIADFITLHLQQTIQGELTRKPSYKKHATTDKMKDALENYYAVITKLL